MRKILIFSLLSLFCLSTHAQYNTAQNRVWHFGNKARLDFNSGTAVSVPHVGPYIFYESSAGITDDNGNTLFFTDGRVVYDRTGHPMLNGTSIVPYGTNSSLFGAVIVPSLYHSKKYYIFSSEEMETPGHPGRLSYSVVDMNMNSGFGAVIPASSGTLIGSGFTEQLVSIQGTACNMWVLNHKRYNNEFVAYPITTAGVGPGVVSATGICASPACYSGGGIRVSHDGLTIVTGNNGVELHDFDPATGIVSNTRRLSTIASYAQEFSPDGTKLYVHEATEIVQYDLSLPTLAAIIASRTLLGTGLSMINAMRLGPDNKIYMANVGYMNTINNPNAAGTACGYTVNVIALTPSGAFWGQQAIYYNSKITITGPAAICIGSTTTLSGSTGGGVWTTGTPAIATVSNTGALTGVSTGTSYVTYTVGGCSAIHTVDVVAAPAPIGGNTTTCTSAPLYLSSATSGGTWSSSLPAVATVNALSGIVTGITSGTTTITYSLGGTCPVATTTVSIIHAPPPITGLPAALCIGSTVTLNNTVAGGFWTTSIPAATINPYSGVLTGVSTGLVFINYTLSPFCATYTTVNVIPAPSAGTISGDNNVCAGSIITLTGSVTGGSWAVANTNASISSTGDVTGLTPGPNTAMYMVSNACATDTAFFPFTVCDTALQVANVQQHYGINISPNPGTGIYTLSISSSHTTGPAYICINNITGSTIFETYIQPGIHTKVDLSAQPPGIYLLTAAANGHRSMYKLVKQ